MFNQIEAQDLLKKFYPEATIKAWTPYLNFYLFRVEHPDPFEKDWDPFFSVDKNTGKVWPFSILTDIDVSEFGKLKWNEV